MINLLRKNNLLGFLTMLGSLSATPCVAEKAHVTEQGYQLATDIADYYTKSFPSEGRDMEVTVKEHAAHEIRPVRLTERNKQEVVFNRIFTKSKKYALLQQNMAPILNGYAWGDFHLFMVLPVSLPIT